MLPAFSNYDLFEEGSSPLSRMRMYTVCRMQGRAAVSCRPINRLYHGGGGLEHACNDCALRWASSLSFRHGGYESV